MKALVYAAAVLVVFGLFISSSADNAYAQFGMERLLRGNDPEQVSPPPPQDQSEPEGAPEINVVSPDTGEPPPPVPPPKAMDTPGKEPSADPANEAAPGAPGGAAGEPN